MPATTPLVSAVDFVVMPTDDFDASVAFYGEVLGLPLVARYGQHPGAEFQAGNLTISIMANEAFGQTFAPNSMPIALRVEDVAAAREHLQGLGVAFVTDVFDSGVCHQAICKDPAGNPISLHHRYAPRTPLDAAG